MLFLRHIILIGFGGSLLFGASALAGEVCPSPQVFRDLLHCALQRHPEVQREQLGLKKTSSQIFRASQRPNPELALEAAFGPSDKGTRVESEVFLSYPFELGGKRKARIQQAKSQTEVAQSQLRQVQEKVLLQTLLQLHRLRQIKVELLTLSEALKTFRGIQGQFRSRPQLSPEQEIALNIFDFAFQDYELRRTKLRQEQNEILQRLMLVTSYSRYQILSHLPKAPNRWPRIKEGPAINPVTEQQARAQIQMANSEIALAKAEAWPNLQVGPLVQYERDQKNDWRYGFGLSVPLPIINRNQGGQRVAKASQKLAQAMFNLEKESSQLSRRQLQQQYHLISQRLRQTMSLSKISRRHHKLHELFQRGVVNPQLVIEAHRQQVDLTRDRHQLEQAALRILWSVYALEGRVFKEAGL